jgi:hypothetical protein
LLRLADAPLAVGVEEQDPLVAANREPVARDGLAIADTLEEGVAADDVLVLACGWERWVARVRVKFAGDEGGAAISPRSPRGWEGERRGFGRETYP